MTRQMAEALAERVELELEGMTCASCAARVERELNDVEGVEATVNFATERARVHYDPERVAPDDLVQAVREAGYGARLPDGSAAGSAAAGTAQAQAAVADSSALGGLRRRLGVSVALTLPVLALSMVPALQFDRWQWVVFALATPVVLWAGCPFHRAALRSLRRRTATMDTLISLGVAVAYGWSLVALLFLDAGHVGVRMEFSLTRAGHADLYFEVAAAIVTLVTIGNFLEARARRRAGSALRELLELGAKEARVLRDGHELALPVEELEVGDLFVVRPGDKVPTDGVVEAGESAIDASLLTGESVPVDVGPGDEVAGATLNSSGRLVVRATRVGADTALAQIARLVEEAQAGKAPVQRLADRASAVFVPVVIAIALGTLAAWLAFGGDSGDALSAAVAVLIIACPCALGLATPTALMVGSGRGAALGVLIRGPEVLESSRRVTTILLDKTGTLTEGGMRLMKVVAHPATAEDVALRLAGAAESGSEHPIARAIVDAARERGPLPSVERFESHAGLGVVAGVDGHDVVVGRPSFLAERGHELPGMLLTVREQLEHSGRTVVACGWDGSARALLAVEDALKPTSAAAVARLAQLGVTSVLVTGDAEPAARAVAAEAGIGRVLSDLEPGEKAEAVAELQRAGETVAMVGDGVNDAPALARADLGIAIGTGADVAIEASDLTLVSGDLLAVVDAIELSRRTLATIRANLFGAFAYNVAAIPLAAAGLLNPIVAAAAMALSSVSVVSNSLRLRRFRSVRNELHSAGPRASGGVFLRPRRAN